MEDLMSMYDPSAFKDDSWLSDLSVTNDLEMLFDMDPQISQEEHGLMPPLLGDDFPLTPEKSPSSHRSIASSPSHSYCSSIQLDSSPSPCSVESEIMFPPSDDFMSLLDNNIISIEDDLPTAHETEILSEEVSEKINKVEKKDILRAATEEAFSANHSEESKNKIIIKPSSIAKIVKLGTNRNGQSVIVPWSTLKGIKAIKFVNNPKIPVKRGKRKEPVILTEQEKPEVEAKPERYSLLCLSEEEKRLMKKEGISLPSHYPLTKEEERELKKIRRKIRNKQSAQDSRKRKKEYMDGLEERVKKCTAENQLLQRKLQDLESKNASLVTQLTKLQAWVSGANKNVQTPTCLMVLLLSLGLLLLPNFKHKYDELTGSGKDMARIDGRSRTLLSDISLEQESPIQDMDDTNELYDEQISKRSYYNLDFLIQGKRKLSTADKYHGKADEDHNYMPPEKVSVLSPGILKEVNVKVEKDDPGEIWQSESIEKGGNMRNQSVVIGNRTVLLQIPSDVSV